MDLAELAGFISRHHGLVSSCVVDFLSEGQYDDASVMPLAWRGHLQGLTRENLRALSEADYNRALGGGGAAAAGHGTASLQEFLSACRRFALSSEPAVGWASIAARAAPPPLTAEEARGMTPKKAHEVAEMAAYTAALAQAVGADTVIDLGCGQGHLDM